MLLKDYVINLLRLGVTLIFIMTTLTLGVTENSQFLQKEDIFYTQKNRQLLYYLTIIR